MENSLIPWTHHTFNPWFGCTEVGPECVHCYARVLIEERLKRCAWGRGEPRLLAAESTWANPLRWDRAAQRDAVRRRVFCASLGDVFDAEVDERWRIRLFDDVIVPCRNLDWLLLTKRPEIARIFLARYIDPTTGMLPPNWWLGVTVGIAASTWRLDVAAEIPARIRFVSAEPLLSPLDLTPWLARRELHWVIAGGESAQLRHPVRKMRAAWARSLRDQCVAADAPFFFKQWGAYGEDGSYVGRRDVGRLLDAVEWSQFPV